jgi:hypothetical protein
VTADDLVRIPAAVIDAVARHLAAEQAGEHAYDQPDTDGEALPGSLADALAAAPDAYAYAALRGWMLAGPVDWFRRERQDCRRQVGPPPADRQPISWCGSADAAPGVTLTDLLGDNRG